MTTANLSDNSANQPGSPVQGEPEFLVIGRLGRTHGVKGEIFMTVLTDFPQRIANGLEVYIGSEYIPAIIKSHRWINRGLLVSFKGYSTPEQVSIFRNQFVHIHSSDSPTLPDGEYYYHQLLGLSAVSESGQTLGTVVEILETGANDVYVVETEEHKEILIPAIDQVIVGIDLHNQTILVRLIPGLISED